MRTLIATEFVSIDGVMEAPGGEPGYAHAGWVAPFFSDELGAYKQAEQVAAETLVLGRRTYESFSGAWPSREGAMAEKINEMDKVLVSTTVDDPGWHRVSVARSVEAVADLKQGDGGPILVAGSRSVVHALLALGALDQLNLQIFPIILGSGMRVWPEGPDPVGLELVSSEAFASGVLAQSYRVGA